MRGASALEKVLEEERGSRLRAFVVWEPIVWTDLSAPSTRKLASIRDTRVAQYWDPEHVVSAAVMSSAWASREGISAQGAEVGGKKVAWDIILLFPPGCGSAVLPEPVFHGDPVVTTMREVREHLRALVHE